jgi:hypothetical protein
MACSHENGGGGDGTTAESGDSEEQGNMKDARGEDGSI